MAEAKKAGGPTQHTRQTLPNWDGWYRRLEPGEQWIWGRNLQTATMLSLLTPEYQKRMVQQNYHEVVNNSPQWNAAFCYPEGFMRWWAAGVARRADRGDDDAEPGAVPHRHRRQLRCARC